MNRSHRTVGLTLVLLLLTVGAACSSPEPRSAPGPSPLPTNEFGVDAMAVLELSTKGMNAGNYRFTASGPGVSVNGSVHLPSRSAELVLDSDMGEQAVRLEFRYLGDDRFVRIEPGTPAARAFGLEGERADSFLRIDPDRTGGLGLDFGERMEDPIGVLTLIAAIDRARVAEDGTYRGQIDLARATESLVVDSSPSSRVRLDWMPFTARVDEEGRLLELHVTNRPGEPVPVDEIRVTIDGYGDANPVEPPAPDRILPAPDVFYELFESAPDPYGL